VFLCGSRNRVKQILCAAAIALLSGCGTETIKVSDGALVDHVDYQWLGSERKTVRSVFYSDDEKVTLSVHFDYNVRAAYEWYRVEWIDPAGKPYKVVSTRTEFGSHRDLQADIKIRDKMAAQRPGLWRVRLYHLNEEGVQDQLLFARLFRIASTNRKRNVTTSQPPSTGAGTVAIRDTPVASSPVEQTGVVKATLSVKKSLRPAQNTPDGLSSNWDLHCPPLYYPPGQGCIEQAPQE